MTEPFLDHLHRYAVCQKQRSAAMPQIVEADAAEAVMLQKNWKLRRDIPRLDALTDLIDIDVLQIVPVVRPAAELAVVLLLLFELQQLLTERRHKRQGTPAGLVLGSVLCDYDRFPVQIAACDRVLNGEGVLVKVNIVCVMEDAEFDDSYVRTLLRLRNPLNALYEEYRTRDTQHMDILRDCFEAEAKTVIKRARDRPRKKHEVVR